MRKFFVPLLTFLLLFSTFISLSLSSPESCSPTTITTMDSAEVKTMEVQTVVVQQKVYPTGNPKFGVLQSFPAALNSKQTDPFLMCDHFGPKASKGKEKNPNSFPVGWHPHRGMDVVTYMAQGVGRHADSLGNRGEFPAPGMQWMSVGSGVEHAEGGGTPEGEIEEGFQIWINVPSERKMQDPRYGTEPPENIPVLQFGEEGAFGRLIAGTLGDSKGPFETVQSVLIIDVVLEKTSQTASITIPPHLDTCLAHIYKGSGVINGQKVAKSTAILLDSTDPEARLVNLESSLPSKLEQDGLSLILFAGKRLNQPIAWQGPFVMTTKEEIEETVREYRTGTFLKKKVSWDYRNFKKGK